MPTTQEPFDIRLGLYRYLEQVGAFGKDANAIAEAKVNYRKLYNTESKRLHRKKHPPFSMSLSVQDKKIFAEAARNHALPLSHFLIAAAHAYLERKYIVPDAKQLVRFEQKLMQIASDIRNMSVHKTDLKTLSHKVAELEVSLTEALTNPPLQ